MKLIRTFDQHCRDLVAAIPQLDDYILVAQDNHAVNKLKDRQGIQLVAVIPSSSMGGSSTAHYDVQSTLFFVLAKASSGLTAEEELTMYEATQEAVLALREALTEDHTDGCGNWPRLQVDSLTIEPEYNAFGGWLGWSLIFSF